MYIRLQEGSRTLPSIPLDPKPADPPQPPPNGSAPAAAAAMVDPGSHHPHTQQQHHTTAASSSNAPRAPHPPSANVAGAASRTAQNGSASDRPGSSTDRLKAAPHQQGHVTQRLLETAYHSFLTDTKVEGEAGGRGGQGGGGSASGLGNGSSAGMASSAARHAARVAAASNTAIRCVCGVQVEHPGPGQVCWELQGTGKMFGAVGVLGRWGRLEWMWLMRHLGMAGRGGLPWYR